MKQSMIIAIIVVVVIVVIAGVYLGTQNNSNNSGSNNSGGTTPVVENPVSITGFQFVSNDITIHVGSNVTWTNNDGTAHTVTSDSNSTFSFESGHINSGSTFKLRFNQVGTFYYHCSIHTTMHGVVRVIPLATG